MSLRIIPLVAAIAIAVGGAVACAQPAAPPPTAAPTIQAAKPASTAPAAAGTAAPTAAAAAAVPSASEVEPTVRLGWNFLYNTMDPATSVGFNARRNDIFEGLVRLEQDGTYTGLAAESWRSVDATTWEFKLRDKSVFHNGDKVTAEDVKFTFDRILDPSNPGLGVVAQMGTIARVDAPDPLTVRIVTKAADPLLVGRTTFGSIISKQAFEAGGPDYASRARTLGERPIGSGPYKFKSYATNQQLTIEAFDHPYRKPVSREIQTVFLADTPARMAALQSRQVDMVASVPVDQVQSLEGQGFKMANVPVTNVQGVFLDSIDWEGKPVAELSDKRVRQALRHAVDATAINNALYAGRSQVLTQLLAKEVNGYDPGAPNYAFNQAQARQLLTAAGFPNGFTMDYEHRVMTSDNQDLATIIQKNLLDIGVRTNLTFITDSTVSLDKYNGRSKRAPLFGFSVNATFGDGDAVLGIFRGDTRVGLLRFRSPAYDAVYIPSQSEVDPAKRKTLMQQASRMLQEEAVYLPTATTLLVYGHDAKVNTRQSADAYPQMEWVYKRR